MVRAFLVASVTTVLVLTFQSPSSAAERCKVRVDRKSGVIEVSARNVDPATIKWGPALGEENQDFFDGACLVSGAAKKCVLADPATTEAKTPPEGCTLYLADASGSCSVWVRGCTPGVRDAAQGPPGPAGNDGLSCWDTTPNSVCDLASEDVNGDLICDALDCQTPAASGVSWSWAGLVLGSDPAITVIVVPVDATLMLTDIHGTSNAGGGSQLLISDDSGVRYVRVLSPSFDVVFGTAIEFAPNATVTVVTTGGTTQLTLSGSLQGIP